MTVMLILKVVVNLFLKYYLPLKKSDLLSLNVTNFKIHILSKKTHHIITPSSVITAESLTSCVSTGIFSVNWHLNARPILGGILSFDPGVLHPYTSFRNLS